jgi:serine/threonine protein kinase
MVRDIIPRLTGDFDGFAMHRGKANLREILEKKSALITFEKRLAFAKDIVECVKALHTTSMDNIHYAWMDIKLENFVLFSEPVEHVVGIDLDHAMPLTHEVPANYESVTWTITPPEIAHPLETKHKTKFLMPTGEQFDMWSLGMTLLAVLNVEGKPLVVGKNDAVVRENLMRLKQSEVDAFIVRLTGYRGCPDRYKDFLKSLLRIDLQERIHRVEDLYEILNEKTSLKVSKGVSDKLDTVTSSVKEALLEAKEEIQTTVFTAAANQSIN